MKAKQEPEVLPAETNVDFASSATKAATPSIAAANRISATHLDIARDFTVTTQAEFEIGVAEVRAIATRKAALNDRRLSITRPMDEAKRNVMELFNEPISRLDEAERMIRARLTAFQTEQRRLADEERAANEKREREEQDKLRAEQDRLTEAARKAAKRGDDVKAQRLLDQADEVSERVNDSAVAPTPVSHRVPTAAGASARETWTLDLPVDVRALVVACAKELAAGETRLLQFISANEVEIGKVVRALRMNHHIPGVRARRSDGLTIRK